MDPNECGFQAETQRRRMVKDEWTRPNQGSTEDVPPSDSAQDDSDGDFVMNGS